MRHSSLTIEVPSRTVLLFHYSHNRCCCLPRISASPNERVHKINIIIIFATTIYTTNTTQIADPLPHRPSSCPVYSMDDTLQLQNHSSMECVGRWDAVLGGGWGRGSQNRGKSMRLCNFHHHQQNCAEKHREQRCGYNLYSKLLPSFFTSNPNSPASPTHTASPFYPLKPSFIAATTSSPPSSSTMWTQTKVCTNTLQPGVAGTDCDRWMNERHAVGRWRGRTIAPPVKPTQLQFWSSRCHRFSRFFSLLLLLLLSSAHQHRKN